MVTAYPERALEAFESNALDYLTKPVDVRRFDAAIDRARQRHSKALVRDACEEIVSEARATLSEQASVGGRPQQLVGEKLRRLYFVDVDTVEYIESDANYVTFYTGEDRYLSRNTLKHLTALLAPRGFVRIQKSLLINLSCVAFAERIGNGTFAFTLRNGRRLESGAAYRRGILDQVRNRSRAGGSGSFRTGSAP